MNYNLTKINRTGFFVALAVVVASAAAVGAVTQRAQAQVPPAAPPAGSSFDQRVGQRKAERKIVFTETDQKRLISTCVNAQTKIRTLQQSTTPAVANRAKINQQIDAKLWIMIGKLKMAGKDTFPLEKQRAELAAKVEASQQTAANYTQSLDDLVVINCKADPEGFKALLDTARIYNTQLRDQSADARNYVNNEVKTSLSNYATDLQGGNR